MATNPSGFYPRHFFKLTPLYKIALVIGVGVHLAGFLLFNIDPLDDTPPPFSPALVQFSPSQPDQTQSWLAEQTLLFDSAPLFLPTRWNTSQPTPPVALTRKQAADPFPAPEPVLSIDQVRLPPDEVALAGDNQQSHELLRPAYWSPFHGFGLGNQTEISPIPAGIGLQAVAMSSGETVVSLRLPVTHPALVETSLWSPAVFTILVDEAGAIGSPMLMESSFDERVDDALRDLLRTLDWTSLVPFGYYRVTVGW
jgi:hypothetical protein